VRDTIIQKIQKEYYHGIDIVQSIRDDEYIDMQAEKPKRVIAEKQAMDEQGILTNRNKDDISTEQDGLDIDYREELSTWRKRSEYFKTNKARAYALIFTYYNKTMQNRVEESANFETKIRDDPLELLK